MPIYTCASKNPFKKSYHCHYQPTTNHHPNPAFGLCRFLRCLTSIRRSLHGQRWRAGCGHTNALSEAISVGCLGAAPGVVGRWLAGVAMMTPKLQSSIYLIVYDL